eukprot:TRINITY_DN6930_c0_g1_i1.p1 TRINITY_DN6930_c0_g1~~TRINITY_DN6930_c0_g1_i1.p1  ORF type:complete len:392 (+),score=93.93 TRINITY_DN6930_c0_g1_i1:48-1223(+)
MEDQKIFLDNAASSFPKPEIVYQTLDKEFRNYTSPKRGSSISSRCGKQRLEDARIIISGLFNITDHNRIIFTSGATHSLNMAILSYKWKEGDGILISSVEHNALSRPARKVAKEKGVNLFISPYKDDQPFDLEFCEELLKENKIRMIACVHASNVIGCILPIQKIGELAEKYKVHFLVDAAQSAGVLEIDVQKMHINMLALPAHKGLYGPSGVGALYIDKTVELNTFMEGGTGNDSGKHEMNPNTVPDSFEVGTIPSHLIMSFAEGVKWVTNETVQKIYDREMILLRRIFDGLSKIEHVKIYGSKNLEIKTAVISFFIENTVPSEVSTTLCDKYNIITRGGFHCAPMCHETLGTIEQKGTVRVSAGYHTTETEVDGFIEAVKQIASSSNPK